MQNANLTLQIVKSLTLSLKFSIFILQFSIFNDFYLSSSAFQFALLHQSLIMSGQHMSLNLLNRVQSHSHHNEKGCTAEVEGDVEPSDQNGGQDTDSRDIEGSSEGDAGEALVDILSGLLAGPDAREVSPDFLHVVSHIVRVEGDRRVEKTEEDDKTHIEKIVKDRTGPETVEDRLDPGIGLQQGLRHK